MTLNAIFVDSSLQSNPRYQFSLKSENIEILPILWAAIFFGHNILPTLFNIYTKSCGNPFGSFRYIYIYTVRPKLSTTWLVSKISFLIMNLFQIGLLFSLPVHTYLLTCETGYWSIFIYVYMTGCVKCHVYFSTFVFANESWFFLCRVLSFIFYWFGMVRRKLTIPERWQAVGMHNGGFSHKRVADHFRVNHSIIVRLMQRFRQTGNVTDRPRAGRPRKTTPREDRFISRRARQRPFSTAGELRGNLALSEATLAHAL
jgi:hypothetical protein